VENQLQRDQEWTDRPKPKVNTKGMANFQTVKNIDAENKAEFVYTDFALAMYDLAALAFESDSTRVLTYMIRHEGPGGTYPDMHTVKDYHGLSHHGNNPSDLNELARVDTIYMKQFTHLLDRLASMKQVDGSTLLDHTVLGFSSGMGNGHSKHRLPTAIFGGKALGVDHQGHLKLPEKTSLATVWHTMLHAAKVPTGEQFQDSAGPIHKMIS
jgi:hypothetical protein